jgi:hypothetical protein
MLHEKFGFDNLKVSKKDYDTEYFEGIGNKLVYLRILNYHPQLVNIHSLNILVSGNIFVIIYNYPRRIFKMILSISR